MGTQSPRKTGNVPRSFGVRIFRFLRLFQSLKFIHDYADLTMFALYVYIVRCHRSIIKFEVEKAHK